MEIIDAFKLRRKISAYVLIAWVLIGPILSIPVAFKQGMRVI